jgi:hypothetical protein
MVRLAHHFNQNQSRKPFLMLPLLVREAHPTHSGPSGLDEGTELNELNSNQAAMLTDFHPNCAPA